MLLLQPPRIGHIAGTCACVRARLHLRVPTHDILPVQVSSAMHLHAKQWLREMQHVGRRLLGVLDLVAFPFRLPHNFLQRLHAPCSGACMQGTAAAVHG